VSFDLKTIHVVQKLPAPGALLVPLHMPLEIIIQIIEAAYYKDNLEVNYGLLWNCTLVCKEWSAAAQELLFRHVALRTQPALSAFLLAVDPSSYHGRSLRGAVIRMRLVLDPNHPSGISRRSFCDAVVACPNLYELNLGIYPREDMGVPNVHLHSIPGFDNETLNILRSGPRITALHVGNWTENSCYIPQLLDIWPSLRSLTISGSTPYIPTSSKPQCALEELRFNVQKAPSIEFTKWLLHHSSDSLRILDIERGPSAQMLDYLVSAHGHTLQSLALPACCSDGQAYAVQRCEQLLELKIEKELVSPKVYKNLPQRLQHIAVSVGRDTTLHSVVDLVRSHRHLRVVTVHLWDGGDNHVQLPILKIACAYKGIELRMTRDIQLFRALIVRDRICFDQGFVLMYFFFFFQRGDPVPAPKFPRITSLRNLQHMRSN
jgi:F-box-like